MKIFLEANVGYQDYLNYEMPAHSSSAIIVATDQTLPSLQPLRHLPYCPLEFWNISERVATAILNANSALEMAQLQMKVFFEFLNKVR